MDGIANLRLHGHVGRGSHDGSKMFIKPYGLSKNGPCVGQATSYQ